MVTWICKIVKICGNCHIIRIKLDQFLNQLIHFYLNNVTDLYHVADLCSCGPCALVELFVSFNFSRIIPVATIVAGCYKPDAFFIMQPTVSKYQNTT